MKIYRATYWDRDLGQMLSWHSNKSSAKIWVSEMLENGPSQGPYGFELWDIPTDKKGLIDWLNANLKSDNG